MAGRTGAFSDAPFQPDSAQRGGRAFMEPKILSTRVVHDGWTKFLLAQVRLEDGAEVEREIIDHGNAVAVLPYDDARRTVILVELFRPAVFFQEKTPRLLEALAGMTDEEKPENAARREAKEEAGLRLGTLEPVGSVWSSPGILAERVDLFLASYRESDRLSEGGGLAAEHEGITVREMPAAELWAMVERGAVSDMKTLTLTLSLRVRHPELFAPAPPRG